MGTTSVAHLPSPSRSCTQQTTPQPVRPPAPERSILSHSLTRRQREICSGVLSGFSNEEIASSASPPMHPDTVKTHLGRIYALLGISFCGKSFNKRTLLCVRLTALGYFPESTPSTTRRSAFE